MKKWVYLFSEGNKDMRDLLGGKGAGVAEMTRAGLPVPPGFTITTEACNAYFSAGKRFPDGLWDQVMLALHEVERSTGRGLGDAQNPLLVSCRSGAKFSMPGMMDTVLNLGLTAETLPGIARLTGNERFAWDSYRRLIQMFGRTVKGIEARKFEHILDKYKKKTKGKQDTDLTTEMLQAIVADFKALYRAELKEDFPDQVHAQLGQAIEAVFSSWFGKRAMDYRNYNKIPHDLGTGVNVQTMVFGNMGDDSATGVAFTRNPSTGEHELYGEYLVNAQGEDVVAGIRTPKKIAEMKLEMPEVYAQFLGVAQMLEKHYREMQDLEFTIEQGKLWMLQTRTGKRTAASAVRVAVAMANEGLITREEAIQRIEPLQINQLLLPRFDEDAKKKATLLARGLNASPGAATGAAVFDADRAKELGDSGQPVILVRPETNPDDFHGMLVARGILTQRGGATSHAAVVARGLGKPCVAGCDSLRVDEYSFSVGGHTIREGDLLSIDGTTGEVFAGSVATIVPDLDKDVELATLLGWADEIRGREVRKAGDTGYPTRGLEVWANADVPRDAKVARKFGAQGIGLCRTEHMFFEETRLPVVREMILNATEAQRALDAVTAAQKEVERRPGDRDAQAALAAAEKVAKRSAAVKVYHRALAKLLPFQRKDFAGLFDVMDGLPVIIRLIDPPLHEFLPSYDELHARVVELRTRIEERQVAKKAGAKFPRQKGVPSVADFEAELAEKEVLLAAVSAMREFNPMLGLRGIRLGIMYPDITAMQVRAIIEAACQCTKRGKVVKPEIMIPLVGHVNELKITQTALEAVAKQVMEEQGVTVHYQFGTMIEVPRAALTANEIAEYAEFLSFGTNDLSQLTYGYSRDDAEGRFLLRYVEGGVLPSNPFQELDGIGVGRLMRMAVEEARRKRPGMSAGVCGEHGGDPASIHICSSVGLNYVSCSPYRVPVARLAAAQAALGAITRDK